MQVPEVAAKLRAWSQEFAAIIGEPVTVPDRFWDFLSKRLVELGVAEEDPDVIVAQVGQSWRKVKLTGKRGARLTYEFADGSLGMGLLEMRHIHPESRPKFTAIIERMLADGRIRE